LFAFAFEHSVAASSLPVAAGLGPYFEFSGVMHPAVSHFPIALLSVAGLVEAWSVIRREKKPASATLVCLSIGTLAAVVATVLGWADADRLGYSNGETINLHRWLGVAVAVLAIAALVLSFVVHRATVNRKVVWAYRANVFAAAGLVGLVGSLGGKLVHGENYYNEAWAELAEATSEKAVDVAGADVAGAGVELAQNVVKGAAEAIQSAPEAVQSAAVAAGALTGVAAVQPAPTTAPASAAEVAVVPAVADASATAAPAPPVTQPTTAPTGIAVVGAPASPASFGGGRIDYVRDIQPIFEANCVKCHNDKKTKGDYRMDAVQHLFAAGETGAAPVVAGKSDESLLVKLIEGKGEYEDSIMPPKGDPLTFQQIALIRRWIDEGAQPGAPQ
jgi:uncharacterized membrane protein